jgi:uncharacterized repeat protein (TIGR01451 family)
MINKKIITILICLGLILPIFGYAVYSPSVQLYVNGSSISPVTISYNSSANLSWSSSNADSCQASGDWSGIKATSGSELISNITSSKNFIITCTGVSGFTTAQMAVNVTNISTFLQVNKVAQSSSNLTYYSDTVSANPGEKVSFRIEVTTGSAGLQGIIVKDTLPSKIIYLGNLKIDNVSYSGDITSGLNIGDLSSNQTKIITFDASVADSTQFNLGTTTLINTVLVYNSLFATSDTAKVMVYKATGGGPTNVPTGLSNNLFLDSFFLPLVISLLIIFIFKSHIINFEEWLDSKKKAYGAYRARKIINKIRVRESLRESRRN